MTLYWIKRHGVGVDNPDQFRHFTIMGGQSYRALESVIARDWSGVAFPLVAGVVILSEVVIETVDFHDSQGDKAVVDHLMAIGADLQKDISGGGRMLKGGKPLRFGLSFDLKNIPDSLSALSIVADFAQGDTTLTGLDAVCLKETDRVAVMQSELGKMGATIDAGLDFMTVHGRAAPHRSAGKELS